MVSVSSSSSMSLRSAKTVIHSANTDRPDNVKPVLRKIARGDAFMWSAIRSRGFDAGEHLQQRGFSGAIRAERCPRALGVMSQSRSSNSSLCPNRLPARES